MRSLILATATVLISGLLSPSVQAEHYRYSRQTAAPNTGYYVGSGGVGDGPYWQGEPTDRLPIWRMWPLPSHFSF